MAAGRPSIARKERALARQSSATLPTAGASDGKGSIPDQRELELDPAVLGGGLERDLSAPPLLELPGVLRFASDLVASLSCWESNSLSILASASSMIAGWYDVRFASSLIYVSNAFHVPSSAIPLCLA